MPNYITAEVRKLVGARSDWTEAYHEVQSSELRRFFQATMDAHPRYWNEEWIEKSRYSRPVAPPAFAVHSFRAEPGLPDPLGAMDDPEFDGVSRAMRPGLPALPIPLSGILNGGYEYQFFSYAEVGERIKFRSSYKDIVQRTGRSGEMVLITIFDEYQTTTGRPLLNVNNTMIMR